MGVDLLKHNQEAYQEINKLIESGIKKIAAPRATGSGKTYLMGALAEQYNNDKKLVLEPTRPLLNSIEEKFDEFGIANTDFITYQKLIRMSDEDIAAMDYKLIFLDECHHGVAPVWGQKINCLINTHSDSIIFGTSATTVRNDGVNVVETLFDNNAIGELPLSTAIARKVLPCPHYIAAIYRLNDEFEKLKKKVEGSTNTKTEKKEFYKKMKEMKEMKLHFEKSYGVPLILNKYIKVQNGRYLVFCKDKKHLDAMRDVVIDWFHTAGLKDVHSYAVYSDYPDKEKDYKEFCEDNSDSAKILFSINMLNEGLHIQDISGVLMLRTTQSNLIYLQQLGRLVEAENLDKYLVVFDFVNSFSSVNDGIGLLKEIKEAIAKEKESDPNFDDSGFEDIDTYFVIDQGLEVQEMFGEIEGRLTGREWTEEEDKLLSKYYGHLSIEEIHNKYLLHRSKIAIQRRAQMLEITYKKNSPMWTNEENEILRKYYPIEGLKVEERLENRTKRAIMAQISRLKLKFGKWTDEEIGILKKYYPTEGLRVKERLKNKTENAILRKSSELNIKSNRYWTEEEIDILKKYYPQYWKSINEFLPNKPISSIKNKARKLNIFADKKRKYKYVYKSGNKYMVRIFIDGQNKMFGTYDSEDEAGRVAMEKAKEYGKAI